MKKTITVVTPCFNEEDNVEEVYRQTAAVFDALPQVQHEHLFIDNCSTDRTVELLRGLAARDSRVKVILNARNFGQVGLNPDVAARAGELFYRDGHRFTRELSRVPRRG